MKYFVGIQLLILSFIIFAFLAPFWNGLYNLTIDDWPTYIDKGAIDFSYFIGAIFTFLLGLSLFASSILVAFPESRPWNNQ